MTWGRRGAARVESYDPRQCGLPVYMYINYTSTYYSTRTTHMRRKRFVSSASIAFDTPPACSAVCRPPSTRARPTPPGCGSQSRCPLDTPCHHASLAASRELAHMSSRWFIGRWRSQPEARAAGLKGGGGEGGSPPPRQESDLIKSSSITFQDKNRK